MNWGDTAWPDLAATFAKQSSGAASEIVGLIPVGAIEQHGPHLPVATDAIIASALCEHVATRTGCLALPTISLGVSYGHGTVLPGTISATPDLLVATVHQYIRWAALSGLRRFLLVNAHFGNTSSLGVATDHVRLFAPQLRVGVVDWWSCSPSILEAVTADGDDIHANRAETSMMMAIAPHLVHGDRSTLADDPDRTGDLVFRYTTPGLSSNGVTGRPSEASAELGQGLLSGVVAAIADRVRLGMTEQVPLGAPASPIFPF